jgi:hypothetical protein
MLRIRSPLLLIAALWLVSFPSIAGQINPPPPVPAPLCSGGNSTLGYTAAGTALVCGTALASGSIANGGVGQIGMYGGLNSVSPLPNVTDSVLVRLGTASPGFSTTLPSSLTIPGYATLLSPIFTGVPLAPTPATATNTTQIATTAYVKAQGYLTGNQAVTLTGDVLGSGTTAITTTLAAGSVVNNLGYTPVPNTRQIVTTAPLAGGGNLAADLTLNLTGPANLTTFPSGTLPRGAGASPFVASSMSDSGTGVTVGSPTGGAQGAGTLNAVNLYVQGVAVGSGGGGGVTSFTPSVIPKGAGNAGFVASSLTDDGTGITSGFPSGGPKGPGTINATGLFVNGVSSGTISGLVTGQLAVAGGSDNLVSSIDYGTTGLNKILKLDGNGTISPTVIPTTGVTAGSCTSCNLTILADGRISIQANGSGSSSGLPGGAANTVQYNNSGTLGGVGPGTPSTVLHGNDVGPPSFGTVANTDLANSSLTIGSTNIALGATAPSVAGLTLASPAVNTPTISGGTINNATVGGTTPASGTFTTLNAGGTLTTNVIGSTQCLQADTVGVTSGSGRPCGMPPGGTSGQIQYNNAGTLSGFTAGGDFTLAPSTGIGTLATVNANAGTFAAATFDAKGRAIGGSNLSGDVTTNGASATLATVNANVGTFAVSTLDAKGRATSATTLNGDVTTSGATATLAASGVTPGSYTFGSYCTTFDAKGRATYVATGACGAASGALLIQTASALLIKTGSKLLIH